MANKNYKFVPTNKTMRPFRFGIQADFRPTKAKWTEFAKKVEASGYDIITMPDHFTNQLAPIPALMSIANATSSLRIGMLVLDNDFRHPVVLAKELATLDVLSNGRLEIGLGAGWMPSDYEFSGITFEKPSSRIKKLEESIAIMKSAFTKGEFNFDGSYFKIKNYEGFPKPLQCPMPPLLMGGGGTKMLTLATKEANIISIANTKTKDFGADVIGRMSSMARSANESFNIEPNTISKKSIDSLSKVAVDEKVAKIHFLAGDRMPNLELNIRPFMINITNKVTIAIENLARNLNTGTQDVLENPFALIGSPEKLIDDLLRRRERWGISYVIVGADVIDSFAPVVTHLKGK